MNTAGVKQMAGVEKPVEGDGFHGVEVATLTGAHFVHDTYQSFLPPLLPVLIRNLVLSKTEAGLLSVFYQVPSTMQPFIGYFADRVDLRHAVILAPAIAATMLSLVSVVPSYWAVMILLIISGFSSAFIHAVGPVMAGRQSGKRLGLGMSIWMTGGELGRTVAPLIVVGAIALLGEGRLYWLMLGGWLVSGLLWWRFRNVAVPVYLTADRFDWKGTLRAMAPVLLPVAVVQMARSFMVGSFQTYLPVLMTDEGSSYTSAGVALAIMQAAGVAGALTGGWISDRLGRRSVLAISFLASPVMLHLFLMGGWLQMLALLGVGFMILSMTPVLMALVQESFPQNRALGNGIYMLFNFSIQSLATLLVGMMGDAWGLRTAYQVSAVIMLTGLPFILLLPKGMSANEP